MSTFTARGLDVADDVKIGDVGFIISSGELFFLNDTPISTELGPKLSGWVCNENNRAIEAFGIGVVNRIRTVRSGERRYGVRRLEGAKASAALEKLGYPKLAAA